MKMIGESHFRGSINNVSWEEARLVHLCIVMAALTVTAEPRNYDSVHMAHKA